MRVVYWTLETCGLLKILRLWNSLMFCKDKNIVTVVNWIRILVIVCIISPNLLFKSSAEYFIKNLIRCCAAIVFLFFTHSFLPSRRFVSFQLRVFSSRSPLEATAAGGGTVNHHRTLREQGR